MLPVVGVIGASRPAEETDRIAFEVGRGIAKMGAVLVCGGLTGVMENACRGAKEEGGLTLGIIPGDSPAEANRFVDIVIPTGMGMTRNSLVVRSAAVLVAVGGSHGTLSEIAFALNFRKKVFALRTWELGKAGAAGPDFFPVATVDEALAGVRSELDSLGLASARGHR